MYDLKFCNKVHLSMPMNLNATGPQHKINVGQIPSMIDFSHRYDMFI